MYTNEYFNSRRRCYHRASRPNPMEQLNCTVCNLRLIEELIVYWNQEERQRGLASANWNVDDAIAFPLWTAVVKVGVKSRGNPAISTSYRSKIRKNNRLLVFGIDKKKQRKIKSDLISSNAFTRSFKIWVELNRKSFPCLVSCFAVVSQSVALDSPRPMNQQKQTQTQNQSNFSNKKTCSF